MERVPEPELMDGEEQARAYARADFSEPHNRFIELLRDGFDELPDAGTALDLGCGAGDISVRFADAFEGWSVHGLDGSREMLRYGYEAVAKARLEERVVLVKSYLPDGEAPAEQYDLVFSNSLLHHLPRAETMWQAIRRWAAPGAPVFVMDLMRPRDVAQARKLADEHMGFEPDVLQRDFYSSLLAAYSIDEIEGQLRAQDLSQLRVEQVSDRHLTVSGHVAVNGGGQGA